MRNLLYIFGEPNSIEPWQILSWKVAVFIGLLSAMLALINVFIGLYQRSKDMRWKQAELARKLFDEIFDFQPSYNALIMIDELSENFQLNDEESISVSFADIDNALTTPIINHSPKAKYIRRCFDALFYHMERVEQSVKINVVRFEDVQKPAEYYIERLALHKYYIEGYINFTKYSGVKSFLERFTVWENKNISN